MKKQEKLYILIFNRWVGYNEGGNEAHIKEIIYFLNLKGHKISLLTTGTEALGNIKNSLYKIYNVTSPKEYYSFNLRIFSILASIWYLIKSFFIISKIILIEKEKIDVLSVHFSLEAFLARFIRLIYGIPYIYIQAGDTDFELLEGKYADVTTNLTSYMIKGCKKFGYKPRVLTKGIDFVRFNAEIPRAERKNYLKIPEKEKLVITVCRLDPRKDLETLIKAAAITTKTNPEIKYLIVGEGTEENKLKELIKKLKLGNQITMIGAVSNTSTLLPKLYRAADVFALPTLYEGFGWVFLEAMASGLPIISTEAGAVPEVIKDAGILIPIKSPEDLAKSIIRVVEKKSIREQLIKRGLKRVQKWSWDTLAPLHEKAYIDTKELKPNLFNRISRFIESFASIGFLIQKTLNFALKTTPNKWGPTKN